MNPVGFGPAGAPVKPLTLILAPTNLGLRPPAPGREPGTWRAPQALRDAGLGMAVGAGRVVELERPRYAFDAEPGTAIRNGQGIRRFALALADAVADCHARGELPVIAGGDCSLLMGALAGCRRGGAAALVHIDGHSDFRHPGNTRIEDAPFAAAGMDLALCTGRGEALLTDWPGVAGPLVPDESVIQIGEREARDADFAWPDVLTTGIEIVESFDRDAASAEALSNRVSAFLARQSAPSFWIHLDLDVLDRAVFWAVDSPGSPGLEPEVLAALLGRLAGSDRMLGLSLTDFDPELDPDGRQARLVVDIAREAFARRGGR